MSEAVLVMGLLAFYAALAFVAAKLFMDHQLRQDDPSYKGWKLPSCSRLRRCCKNSDQQIMSNEEAREAEILKGVKLGLELQEKAEKGTLNSTERELHVQFAEKLAGTKKPPQQPGDDATGEAAKKQLALAVASMVDTKTMRSINSRAEALHKLGMKVKLVISFVQVFSILVQSVKIEYFQKLQLAF